MFALRFCNGRNANLPLRVERRGLFNGLSILDSDQ